MWCSLTLGDKTSLTSELVQPRLQRLSSAMQPTHHSTNRNVEDLGDLLVGKTFDVTEQDGHPELFGKGLDRLLDLCLGDVVEHLLLGAAPRRRPGEPTEAPVEVEALDVID